MNDQMVFGQYIHKNSLVHKLDARTKIIVLILMMVSVFLIPKDNFIILGIALIIPLIGVILSKISIIKYLKSLKQVSFVVLFSFVFQLISTTGENLIVKNPMNFTAINILIVLCVWVLYFILRKYIYLKLLCFTILLVASVYFFRFPIYGTVFKTVYFDIYKEGLVHGSFLVGRVFVIILASTTMTLTTKPTDMTNAIEWLLKPLELIKIKTSIFAMMISIALRSIPTLFNETNRILKAQASRGVDFNEGKLHEQAGQIISLLIPMFVISIKRAEDLADAMEARGYIPGAKRTRLVKMQFKVLDYILLIVMLCLFVLLILGKCGVYAI